jgi:hypothetical protein
MYERVPVPKPTSHEEPLTAAASQRLDRVEAEMEGAENWGFFRNRQLKMLHDSAVALFINSPGFGVARMIYPSEQGLSAFLEKDPVPLQPGPRIISTWSPGELEPPSASDEAFVAEIFEDSVKNFVFAQGWGYLKDRRHVAGFLPHRFRQVPAPTGQRKVEDPAKQLGQVPVPTTRWTVRTLDLVGLLLHDEPVVYISDHLPRMDELRGAPTRPPDKFESLGLASLRHGEDLFISRDGECLRMLGAVYSTKQCVACHGGQRGDLLGAFSYTLQRDSTLKTCPPHDRLQSRLAVDAYLADRGRRGRIAGQAGPEGNPFGGEARSR